MSYAERLMRSYGQSDWIARFILTTCYAAALNLGDCFLDEMAAYRTPGTHVEGHYVLTVCSMGPPPAFYPRLIALGAMLIATLFAFKRTSMHRVLSGTALAGALTIYVFWWVHSYNSFQNFQMAGIEFLNHVELRQAAYLYGGSWLDLGVVLMIVVCLVLVLDRLFDGEKHRYSHMRC
jgi:hypothetical protein